MSRIESVDLFYVSMPQVEDISDGSQDALQPYAGLKDHELCEYPVELKPVARAIAKNALSRDRNGQVAAPDAPGLGIEVDVEALKPYLVEVSVKVNGKSLYETPVLRR